jgi:hypothetical protein
LEELKLHPENVGRVPSEEVVEMQYVVLDGLTLGGIADFPASPLFAFPSWLELGIAGLQ